MDGSGGHADLTALEVPELLDKVLENLHDDMHTMCLCSLVSRLWNATARHHIFAKITLPSKSSNPRYIPDSRRTEAFLKLVDANPALASCVRDLHLVCDGEHTMFMGESYHSDNLWTEEAALSSALTRLANVRSVTLDDFIGDSLPAMARVVIAAFPQIEALVLTGLDMDYRDPEPRWTQPPPLRAFAAGGARSAPLKSLSLLYLYGTYDTTEWASAALARDLAAAGELAALASLHLLSDAGVSHAWLPLFPALGRSLAHLSLSVNDIVPDINATGDYFYFNKAECELRESVVTLYAALPGCPLLRSLHIKYDGYPSCRQAQRVDSRPLLSPFFLDELAAVFARDPPPLPLLETLSFGIQRASVDSLACCGDAWHALLSSLVGTGTGTSGSRGLGSCRYPRFRSVDMRFSDPAYGSNIRPFPLGQDPEEKGREMLWMFADAGIEVEVSVC